MAQTLIPERRKEYPAPLGHAFYNRVNVGCGQTPTKGWTNYDRSPSILLAKHPLLVNLLRVSGPRLDYIAFCKTHKILRANAAKRIPETDGSVGVLYASHMLEHLSRRDACRFLREARRVLTKYGILRLAVPDLAILVQRYNDTGDADRFVGDSLLVPGGLLDLLGISGHRHRWMYDGESLCRLLSDNGFTDPAILSAGETTIPNPEALDLYERSEDSVYVEARKP